MSNSQPEEYVTNINPNDVLFGRGSGPNDHEGNIKFRDMVARRKHEYMATNHRQTKGKIAKEIVDTVFSNHGRFLKKLDPPEIEKLGLVSNSMGGGVGPVDFYAVVDEKTIMEKAKQALRQNRDKHTEGGGDINSTTPTQPSPGFSKGPDPIGSSPPHGFAPAIHTPPHGFLHQQRYVSDADQLAMTEPIPIRNMNPVPSYPVEQQQPLYTEDSGGYATYTTMLGDPEDEKLFSDNRRQPSAANMMDTGGGNRRDSFGATAVAAAAAAAASSGPRRGSLLGGRRDSIRNQSLQLGDVWRRDSMMGMRGESMQMSEMMESFKGMSTTGDFNSSSDTIGTIDNMYGSQFLGGSNMSVISLSSNTSLFKAGSVENDSASGSAAGSARTNNSSDNTNVMMTSFRDPNSGTSPTAKPDDQSSSGPSSSPPQQQQQLTQGGTTRQDKLPTTQEHRTSLVPGDLWNSKNVNNLMRASLDGSSGSATLGLDNLSANPRPVALMEESADGSLGFLGSSSLSVLRAATGQSSSSLRGAGVSATGNFSGGSAQSIFDINKSSERILPPERK